MSSGRSLAVRGAAAVVAAMALAAALGCGTRCLAAPAAPAAAKPDVPAAVQAALAAYKDGKLADAVSQLQKAIAQIQQEMQGSLGGVLPLAPAGWAADEIKSTAAAVAGEESGSWTNVSRRYTRKADSVQTDISLTNSPQLVKVQKQMADALKNPQVLQAMKQGGRKDITPVTQPGWSGWMIVSREDDSAEVNAFSAEGYFIKVHVGKADAAALQTFWKAIDLKAIGGAAKAPGDKP